MTNTTIQTMAAQRNADGLLYMITEQEHADNFQPSKDRLACMRCKAIVAELTLTGNGVGDWYYCVPCAKAALYGVGTELGSLAGHVRYVYRRPGSDRGDLSREALTFIDHWNRPY